MLSLKFQWWTGLTFIIPKAHTHTFSIAVINDEFPYFRRLAVRKPTWLTSKLTEPLWSVSNALNRKCAYVEASAERTNTHVVSWLQLNQQQQEKMLQKGNFVAFLQRIKKCSTMFFFFIFHDKRKENMLRAKSFICFLCCEPLYLLLCLSPLWTDISKPPNVFSLVPRVESLHNDETVSNSPSLSHTLTHTHFLWGKFNLKCSGLFVQFL